MKSVDIDGLLSSFVMTLLFLMLSILESLL